MHLNFLPVALATTEYSAPESRLVDARSRALIAEIDASDKLGFARDLRKRK